MTQTELKTKALIKYDDNFFYQMSDSGQVNL